MKTVIKLFTVILLFGAVAAIVGGIIFYQDYQKAIVTPVSNNSEEMEFVIEEGESTDQIAQRLEEAGLIKSKLYFKLYLRQNSMASTIQAGTFDVPQNLSMKELVEVLQNAQIPDITVVIPESLMIIEIADILEDGFSVNPEPSFSKEEFLTLTDTTTPAVNLNIPAPADQTLEGYLFPDTYTFPADSNAEYVLNAMLDQGFRTKIYEKYLTEINQSEYTLYEILNLASILERETKHPDDRPIVADILLRRLENGWKLEVDATLLYYYKDWTHEITYQDLELETPYNTRVHGGLPPTPICNPGQETVNAVLNPEPNDYWFYVSDTEGNLHYATTIDEHNTNVQQYIYGN